MNTFQQLIDAAQFQITGGSQYLWNSFGQHARWLDFEVKKLQVEMNMVFDCTTQEVYQAALYFGDNAFRWINPAYVESFKKECYQRDIDPRLAFEGKHFTDCDLLEDFVSKVKQCFTTGQCDTDVIIPLDLSPEVQEIFDKLPEGTDIEQFIINALSEKLEKMSQFHRGNWDIVFSALSQAGINANIDIENAPIAEHNIQEIYDWVKSLNLENVNLLYSDKQTEKGLVSFISVDNDSDTENVFQYLYKKA